MSGDLCLNNYVHNLTVKIKRNRMDELLRDNLRRIKLLILDVDGVLTDGKLTLSDDGKEFKSFHAHDGIAIRYLLSTKIEIAIITARQSNVVTLKAKEFGIKYLYQGAKKKINVYRSLLDMLNLERNDVAYMGDDIADLAPMKESLIAVAPANASDPIKQIASIVTRRSGGEGAVRELIEIILSAKGIYEDLLESFSN